MSIDALPVLREKCVALLAELIREQSDREELMAKSVLLRTFEETLHTAPERVLPEIADPASEPSPDGSPGRSCAESSDTDAAQSSAVTVQNELLSRRALLAGRLGKTERTASSLVDQKTESGITEAQTTAITVDMSVINDFEELLVEALSTDEDLAVITGPAGEECYHSLSRLSATYASILAGLDEPCRLMAETVRSNSQLYPRPIPLDMFEYPPFNFSHETVEACLKSLAENPDYADIRFVESSVDTVYLYSETYMERGYAAFLAERADVGLLLNP